MIMLTRFSEKTFNPMRYTGHCYIYINDKMLICACILMESVGINLHWIYFIICISYVWSWTTPNLGQHPTGNLLSWLINWWKILICYCSIKITILYDREFIFAHVFKLNKNIWIKTCTLYTCTMYSSRAWKLHMETSRDGRFPSRKPPTADDSHLYNVHLPPEEFPAQEDLTWTIPAIFLIMFLS